MIHSDLLSSLNWSRLGGCDSRLFYIIYITLLTFAQYNVEKHAQGFEFEFVVLNFGLDFLTVTPGIRVQQEKGDQTRVASLETAVKENTDYIVLGREISQAENIGKMINKLESYII